MYVVRRHLQKLFDFGMKEMIGSKAPSGMSGGNRPWTMNLAKKSTNGNGDSVAGSRYEEAVNELNTLQSNASVLAQVKRKNKDHGKNNLEQVQKFAERAGLTLDKLDKLSIIHVSGTKGKGSVCALCESMLRASGYKTGFFSSPHLVEVRERIRINGKPLAKDAFSEYFFTIFDRLQETKASHGGAMPAYFRFLTIMAFHVFLKEKVDVAVIEVGLGGSYDCTNIIRKPVVVGITSLGLDHMAILGDTIEEIAWHKAAISKPGRPAFTVEQQEGAMNVVMDTANKIGVSSIQCIPDISCYDFSGIKLRLGLAGRHQLTNASLALQLCKTWVQNYQEINPQQYKDGPESLRTDAFLPAEAVGDPELESSAARVGMPVAEGFVVPCHFMKGLEECYWPGRNQVVKGENLTYYIDGAHTPRSITVCQEWFISAADEEAWILDRPIKRILIFNSTGNRDEYSLLKPLTDCQFDGAAFCPNITGESVSGNSADSLTDDSGKAPGGAMGNNDGKKKDQTTFNTTNEKQLARCKCNLIAFENLVEEEAQSDLLLTIQDVAKYPSREWHSRQSRHRATSSICKSTPSNDARRLQSVPQNMYQTDSVKVPKAATKVLDSISDALHWAATWADQELTPEEPSLNGGKKQKPHVQVLITGSLHLVGGVIKVLDPELVNRPGS
ncbi:folylpolyglutamate synthase, mitochondrial-like isoform X1 [Asterias rubens]|uniref:folylpolyglutamate synthase, mitochondrial-like isoform X1 n=1 Tax=Asterias rubens TaxID=7604 RepID=UPI0014552593|nr:folylpolyglutamate synthase, mitochondrial-like isoform X1 [Asterias rubens]